MNQDALAIVSIVLAAASSVPILVFTLGVSRLTPHGRAHAGPLEGRRPMPFTSRRQMQALFVTARRWAHRYGAPRAVGGRRGRGKRR